MNNRYNNIGMLKANRERNALIRAYIALAGLFYQQPASQNILWSEVNDPNSWSVKTPPDQLIH